MGFNVYFKENINGFTYDNMVQYYVKLLTMNFDDIVEHKRTTVYQENGMPCGRRTS